MKRELQRMQEVSEGQIALAERKRLDKETALLAEESSMKEQASYLQQQLE
jgi:hypothetical protein